MTNEQFTAHIDAAYARRKELLKTKKRLYATGSDRLEQFHRAASAQNIKPTEALIGMATKHFTAITDMCKDPSNFTFNRWHEVLDDLRNYMDLLDALVNDVKE
jgi:hypothetical protein